MIRLRAARWKAALVPVIGAILLIGVAASVGARTSSSPSLPPVSPERLIAATLRALARDRPVSGRLTAHLDLGLPAIPDEGPGAVASGAAGFLASLSGNHRLRMWSSADGFRLADLLRASERGVFVSRTDAWAWDFDSFTAYHLGRLEGHPEPGDEGRRPELELVDPLTLARRALEAITPSTRVAVTGTTRVAGRDAYVLALEPRTSRTLVGKIEIAVDAGRRLPLRVALIPRGRNSAAISVGFTSISFGSIDPSVYRFRPPPGAKVRDLSREFDQANESQGTSRSERGEYGTGSDGEGARLFGHDWATIVALRTPSLATFRGSGDGFDPSSLLPLSGPLLSVRLVDRGDHGWLVYGLVPQEALKTAARELP